MTLRVLPIVQVAIFMVLMFLVDTLLPVGEQVFVGRIMLSSLLVIIALSLVLAGGAVFRKQNTTVNPLRPEMSSALVVNGVYNMSRNPMYVGFLILLIAWGIYLSNLFVFLLLPLFIWVITCTQIIPEERVLEKKFGDEYRAYKARVRRWI